MKAKIIIDKINEYFPVQNASKWDSVGYQLGKWNKNINKMIFVLDITTDVVDFVIKNKINLIVTYHPFIFGNKSDVLMENAIIKKNYLKLKKLKVVVYSLHTSLDNAKYGINDWLINKLNVHKIIKNCGVPYRLGIYKKYIPLEEIVSLCKKAFNIKSVLTIKGSKEKFNKLMIAGGSHDKEIVDEAIKQGVDLIITGETKYHNQLYAKENNITLLLVHHFMENLFNKEMTLFFKEKIDIIILWFENQKWFEFR